MHAYKIIIGGNLTAIVNVGTLREQRGVMDYQILTDKTLIVSSSDLIQQANHFQYNTLKTVLTGNGFRLG